MKSMNAQPAPEPRPAAPHAGKIHGGRASELMKEIGAKKWAPMPEDQFVAWQDEGESPDVRFWSLMCAKTIAIGHLSPYATDGDGNPLYVENLANILKTDPGDARRTLRKGVARGRYRMGTKAEGPRRIYLCGRVIRRTLAEVGGEEKAYEKVCTDLFPPYILKRITQLDPAEQKLVRQEWVNEEEAEDLAVANATLLIRRRFTERKSTILSRRGIEKIREAQPIRGLTPEEYAAREAQLSALGPAIENLVQTSFEFVRTRNKVCTEPEIEGVQTAASLLPSDPTRNPLDRQRAEGPEASGSRSGREHDHDGREHKLLYGGNGHNSPQTTAKNGHELPALATDEERKAEGLFFSEIARMQEHFKHADFSRERISRDSKSDRVLVRRLLALVGADTVHVMKFLLDVAARFKGLDRNAIAKLPPRSPEDPTGPRSLGLILHWAEDFARTESHRGSAKGATA